MKTLILYAYCENQKGNALITGPKDNLLFFLNNGIINNDDYTYCININGFSEINFDKYLKTYNNLKIFKSNGKCAYDGWNNILNNINISEYYYYIFLKDKIRGPYYTDQIKDWVSYFTSKLSDEYRLICSGYGVSPEGKIYKYPYFTEKCFCIDKELLDLIIDNDFLIKYKYDCKTGAKKFDQVLEIQFSKYLLDNNYKYVSLDSKGIYDLELNKYYNSKNFDELLIIAKRYYSFCDQYIPDKLFWTSKTIYKIHTDSDFSNNIKNQIRDTSKVKIW
jgi:hypothetical protein